MKIVKPIVGGGICFGIAAVVALSVWPLQHGGPGLSHLAHRVGRLQGAVILQGPQRPEWLSDHEAMYLSYHPEGDRFEFMKIDTDTGDQTPMDGLNQKLASELRSTTFKIGRNPTAHLAPDFVLSPSRELIVITENGTEAPSNAHPAAYHVTDTKGTVDFIWRVTSNVREPPLWLLDNKRCVQPVYLNRATAQVFNIRSPGSTSLAGLGNGPPNNWLPVGSTKLDRIWGYTYATNAPKIFEWDVFRGAACHAVPLSLPVSGLVYGAAIAPSADRVAWLILYNRETPVSRLMKRIHPAKNRTRFERLGVWISNLDGSQMKEADIEDASNYRYNDGYIRWLPGGRMLAFHMGSDLYMVAIDR